MRTDILPNAPTYLLGPDTMVLTSSGWVSVADMARRVSVVSVADDCVLADPRTPEEVAEDAEAFADFGAEPVVSDNLCGRCQGSGEGHADGTVCPECGGAGELRA